MASYINTGFKSRNNSNKDLIDIFEPHFGPTLDYQTKYKSRQNSNLDLNNIFQLYTAGDLSANTTNFNTFNGTAKVDLNNVFRIKNNSLPSLPVQSSFFSASNLINSCSMYDKYAIIITNNLIYHSSDYGAIYTLSSIPSISNNLVDCCIFGSNAIAITGRQVLYSSNFGKTWTLTTSLPYATGMNYTSCSICDNYAILSDDTLENLYGSSDFGKTWTDLNVSGNPWDKVSISKTGTFGNYTYVAIASHTHTVNNRRIHYCSNFTGTPAGTFTATSSSFTFNISSLSLSGTNGIMCISNLGIYYTINGGATWLLSYTVSNVRFCSLSNAIDASFNTTYVGMASGGSQIYITRDGGQTWSIINASNYKNCAISNGNAIVYYNPGGAATGKYMSYGKA